jgi:predicted lipoprotein
MKSKPVKYIVYIVIAAFVCYNSVYFKKLDEVKNSFGKTFDATGFTDKLWKEKLPAKMDSAIELTTYLQLLKSNPAQAFDKYSNALAIGNYRYSLIKTIATVIAIDADDIDLTITSNGSSINAKLATEFIYGNAIRDASQLVDVKDFVNSGDLNSISEAFNKKVKTEVLPSFKTAVKKGSKLQIVAALEMNKEHIKLDGLELIPVQIQILP